MKRLFILASLMLLAMPAVRAVYGQSGGIDREREKRAQSGLQFLDISVDPRSAAMGDAVSAVDMNNSMALFYNPASMARLEGMSIGLNTAQWFADIQYSNAAVAFSPAGGRYGVFGVSLLAVDYGELEGTVIDEDPAGPGYVETGTFAPTALAVGIGYAKSLSDRFSVGGAARYAYQDLGESMMNLDGEMQDNTVSTPVFDFGVFYATGFRSLNLAVTARNFSPAVTFEEEGFEAPLSLNIGVSMNVMDLFNQSMSTDHALLVGVEGGHPRSYDEQIRIGGEYRFMNLLSLRAGYTFPSDEQGISVGGGLNVGVGSFRIGADYAYSGYGILGDVNRVGLHIGF